MPLSEDEKRILRQIEQQLEQDPAFSSRGYRIPRRRLGLLGVAVVVTTVLAVLGLLVNVWVGLVGVAVLFAVAVAFERELRVVVREHVQRFPISVWMGAARRPRRSDRDHELDPGHDRDI